jgi:hypothetical protein
MKLKLLVVVALIVLGGSVVSAQTLFTTNVQVNQGAPARAIFVFGNIPGATELVVQCDIAAPFAKPGRAWLIENFDVYGKQATTSFFPVVCTEDAHDPIYAFSVAPTTANVTLYNWDGTTTPVTVTLYSDTDTTSETSWQSRRVGCGRSGSNCYKYGTGAAMITIATN